MFSWLSKWLFRRDYRPACEILMDTLLKGKTYENDGIKVRNYRLLINVRHPSWGSITYGFMRYIPEINTILCFSSDRFTRFEGILRKVPVLKDMVTKFSKDVFFLPVPIYVSDEDVAKTLVSAEVGQFCDPESFVDVISVYRQERNSYMRVMRHFEIPSIVDKYHYSRVFIPKADDIDVQDMISLLPRYWSKEFINVSQDKDEEYYLARNVRAIFSYPGAVPTPEKQLLFILKVLKDLTIEEYRSTEWLKTKIYNRSHFIGMLIAIGRIDPEMVRIAFNKVDAEKWYRPEHYSIIAELIQRLASFPIFQHKYEYDFSYKVASLMVKSLEQ